MELLKTTLALLILFICVSPVLAADFRPGGDVDLQNFYNIKKGVNISAQRLNASVEMCIAGDCRSTWPSGSGGGGIGTIQSNDSYVNVQNGSTSIVGIVLSSFDLRYALLSYVQSLGNWTEDKTSYLTATQSNNKFLQNQTCIGGYVIQNATTNGAQCIPMSVDTDTNNYTVTCSVSGTGTKTAQCSRNGGANYSYSWTDIDTDINNYTIACSVSGTTSKTATCNRSGDVNYTFSWTDIDTDTDTRWSINTSELQNQSGTLGLNKTFFTNWDQNSADDLTLAIIANNIGNFSSENNTIVRAGTASCGGTDQVTGVVVNRTGVFINCSAQGSGGGMSSWTLSNGSTTDTISDGGRVNITGGRNITISQVGSQLVINGIDTDTWNTTAQMIAGTNNTLDALRIKCGNITGASSNLCTLADTDTNSGGNMSVLRIAISTGNSSQLLNNSLLNLTCGTGLTCNLVCGAGTCNLTVTNTVVDTDTFNTTAQMQAATNNTLNALRVACGNVTGASSNLCTIVDTDTNSGGVSNLTLAQVNTNMGNYSANALGYLNGTSGLWTGNISRISALESANVTTNTRIDNLNTSTIANDSAQASQISALTNQLGGNSTRITNLETTNSTTNTRIDNLNASVLANQSAQLALIETKADKSQVLNITTVFSNASGDVNVTGTYGALVLKANCVAITGSASLCDGDDATGGGAGGNPFNQSLNTSDKVLFRALNLTNSGDVQFYLNDTAAGKLWQIQTGTSGSLFNIITPGGATPFQVDNNAGAVYLFNTRSTASYSGAYALRAKAASGQTANIFELVDNSDAVLLGVNGTGALNSSVATFVNVKGCDTLDTDVDGRVVCGTDDSGVGGGDGTGGWSNHTGNITLNNTAASINMTTMYIDNENGRVGVGRRSTTNRFEVYHGSSGADLFQLRNDADGADLLFDTLSGGQNRISGGSGDDISIGTNSQSNLIYVDSTGFVGIGTNAPTTKLDVNGTLNVINGNNVGNFTIADGRVYLGYDMASLILYAGTAKSLKVFTNANTTPALTIATNSQVGINTVSPTATLDVNGTMMKSNHPVSASWTNKTTVVTQGNGTTLRNITGLEWVALANVNYSVDCTLYYDSNVTTNGISLTFDDWGSTVSSVRMGATIHTVSTTTSNSGSNSGMGTKITSTAVQAANTVYVAKLYATIDNGASNVVITPQVSAEVATDRSSINTNSVCTVSVI